MLAESSRGLPLPLNAIFDTPTFRTREATLVLLTQLGSNTAVNFEASKRLGSSEFWHPALCALHRMARHLPAYMSPQAVRHISLALQPYSSSDLVPQGFIGRSVLLSWRTKPTDVSSAPACEPISLRTSKPSHLFMCPRPAFCLPSTLVCRSCFSITRMLFVLGPPSIHSFVAVMNCVNGHPMPLFSKDTLPPQSRISPPLLSAPCLNGSMAKTFFQESEQLFEQFHQAWISWCRANDLPGPPQGLREVFNNLQNKYHQAAQGRYRAEAVRSIRTKTKAAIWHCEDHRARQAVCYCPCLCHQALSGTFENPAI